ncbi:MAG: oligosaccharide flippase family protein [Chitinophagales bacterium]|nr:oligosaccharide flippase family protein [Chitinophagales bacterium]
MNIYKSFFKDTAIYGIASVLPRVINVGLVAIHTKVFLTEEFSSMTTWYVYAAFINVILTLGLETSFFRFFTSESDKTKVVSTSFTILVLSSLTFLLVGYLFSGSLSDFFGFSDQRFLSILLWTTALDTLTVIPFAYLRVVNKSFRFLMIKTTNILILAFFTVLFLIWIPKYNLLSLTESMGMTMAQYKPQVLHIFIANVIASFLTLVLLLPELKKMTLTLDRAILTKLMRYGIPIMIGGVAYVINENMDKLIIPALIGDHANGIYAACYKLGVFMTLYITAFRMGAEPFFFNNAHLSDAKQKYSKIMTGFVAFGSLFLLLVVVFVDLLAGIFLKQKVYLEALYIVPIILLANLFSGIYSNLAVWYKLTDKTKFGMYISMFGGVLTIVSLMVLVPLMGILGAAYATLFTYFSMAMISWYFGRQHYAIPYELPKLFGIIAVGVLISQLSFYVFRGNYLMNILLVLGYITFLWALLKKDIDNVLNTN